MTVTYHVPTADQFRLLSVAVDSSAIARLAIVLDNDNIPHLLVLFNSNPDKVYRYIFEDEGAAHRWHELLNDDEAKAATSWGYEFNRALKHGDIETIDI